MKYITFLILAVSFYSCRKSEDAPPVVTDPIDSVMVRNSYPRKVIYTGSLKVNELQATSVPEKYLHFDTVYTGTQFVRYPDSGSVTLHLDYWIISSTGQRFYLRDSINAKLHSSGEYLSWKWDFYTFRLRGDSLNIRIHHSGGPSHQLDVNFAGIRVR